MSVLIFWKYISHSLMHTQPACRSCKAQSGKGYNESSMAITQKIKKRNGEIVDFNPEKITIVIKRAFAGTLGDSHDIEAGEILTERRSDRSGGDGEERAGNGSGHQRQQSWRHYQRL